MLDDNSKLAQAEQRKAAKLADNARRQEEKKAARENKSPERSQPRSEPTQQRPSGSLDDNSKLAQAEQRKAAKLAENERRQAEKREARAQARSQPRSDLAQQRRINREIIRTQAIGRLSNWLREKAMQSGAIAEVQNSFGGIQQAVELPGIGVFDAATGKPISAPFGPSPRTRPQEAAETCIGLGLYVRNQEVWVNPGTIAGELPPGFDSEKGKSVAVGGVGEVYAKVEIDQADGSVTSVSVLSGSSVPNSTSTSSYLGLGSYTFGENGGVTVTNYGCGSVHVTVCRNWFTAEAPFYGVTFQRG